MELIRARSMALRRDLVAAESLDSSGGVLPESRKIKHRIMNNFIVPKDSMGRRSANSVRKMRDHLAAAERSLPVHRRVCDILRYSCLCDAVLHVQCLALLLLG